MSHCGGTWRFGSLPFALETFSQRSRGVLCGSAKLECGKSPVVGWDIPLGDCCSSAEKSQVNERTTGYGARD